MPSSRPSTIPVVIHLLRQLRPRSILDIGIGFGKWGHLFREYTDINESERDPARYPRSGWQVRIDGIEGHAPYVTEMHRYIYNELHLGDAMELLPRLPIYDLVFLGDIIEHFEHSVGQRLLNQALEHAGRAVIISTPKYETDQEDLCGNELERHRSLWKARDFQRWPNAQVKTVNRDTLIAVLPKAGQKPLDFSPEARPSRDAAQRMRQARAELVTRIPIDERFTLIDEEQLRPTLPHRDAHAFTEREGQYWGPPADGAAALEELKRQEAAGSQTLALLWSAFWWIDYYPELRDRLQQCWRCDFESAALRIYRR